MGLIFTKNTEQNSTILIWHINESVEELLVGLSLEKEEEFVYSTFKMEESRQQWLAVRQLVNILFPEEPVKVQYTDQRKPFLSNQWKMSVSHSGAYVVVILNKDFEVGIDIQIPKKNIKKGQQLFISEEEQLEFGSDISERKLHLCWCAKESLYKLLGDNQRNVYTDFKLKNFKDEMNSGTLEGLVVKEGMAVTLDYIITNDYYLVWTSACL